MAKDTRTKTRGEMREHARLIRQIMRREIRKRHDSTTGVISCGDYEAAC